MKFREFCLWIFFKIIDRLWSNDPGIQKPNSRKSYLLSTAANWLYNLSSKADWVTEAKDIFSSPGSLSPASAQKVVRFDVTYVRRLRK